VNTNELHKPLHTKRNITYTIQLQVCTFLSSLRLPVVIDRRSHGRNCTDYFRTHLGFRNNYGRKSALPFVPRIKFALLFFDIQRYRLLGEHLILPLSFSLFICLSICPFLFSSGCLCFSLNFRTEETDEDDVGLRIDIGSFQAGRSVFCVEPVERMNYLSESLISRAK